MKTSQKRKIRRHLFGNRWLIAITLLTVLGIAYLIDCASGVELFGGVAMAITGAVVLPEAEFQAKVLGATETLTQRQTSFDTKVADFEKRVAAFESGQKTSASDIEALKKSANELQIELQKMRTLRARTLSSPAAPGSVSLDCARHLGAVSLALGAKGGQLAGARRDWAEGLFKDITGVEMRTALTASDIPLPVEYSGEVVELVGQYGAARQYGTVFPLGAGSVKLPRLKTDTTFTLIAGSGTVTEKSPQTEWVTFTPEKFGGLIRLPTELDEDSIVPIGQFLARYAARNIARAEDHNFFVGTGAASGVNGTAEGLTKAVVTNSKTSVTGTLGSPSEMTIAHLRAVRAVPDASAIRMGAYYMHPSFEQLLSTYNTSGAKPYNPQAQIAGNGSNPFMTGPTLDGFPVRWVDVMPVYTSADAVSTVHVLFGDVSFQYLGVRGGIRFDTSTEAGFTTDEILVRALERFTVGLMATGAVGGVITHSA